MNIPNFLQKQAAERGGEWRGILTIYLKLSDPQRRVADLGIERYLTACSRMGVLLESPAVKEIIVDASNGRQVWLEDDFLTTNERVGYGPTGSGDDGDEDFSVHEYSFGVV